MAGQDDTANLAPAEEVKEVPKARVRIEGPIICPGHSRPVPDIEYTNVTDDGYFLISSCLDGKSMLREGHTGDWIGTFLGHKGAVWCTRLTADATKAATGAADFSAKLFDAVSGNELHSWTHKHIVKTVLFSHDSAKLYTAGYEKKIRIFDLEKPDADPTIMEGCLGPITHSVLCSDPNLMLTASTREDIIRVWDVRTGQTAKTISAGASKLHSMSTTTDGNTICTTAGKTVAFYNASNLELIKSFEMETRVHCTAFHAGTKRFVTGSEDELWVRAFDFDSGKEIACNKGHHGWVRCLAFNPDGDNYASGSEDGTIRIWEWAPGLDESLSEGVAALSI